MKKLILILACLLSACGGQASATQYAPFVISVTVPTYAITSTTDANGTISPLGVTQVTSGGSQAYSMSCNSGYTLASVTVDGSAVTVSSPYTFVGVVTTHTITFSCTVTPNIPTSYAAAVATAVALPNLGTPIYFCDCGTNASGSCVAGNDANAGTSTSAPKQTIGAAVTALNGSAVTVALCKGGAFNNTAQYSITRTCTAGTTCAELREFSPTTFTSTAAPVINDTASTGIFTVSGNRGGVRFLNMKMDGLTQTQPVFFFYNGAHDISIMNVEMANAVDGIYDESGGASANTNIIILGSKFQSDKAMGYIGSSHNLNLSANWFEGTGSDTIDGRDHAIYLGSALNINNVTIANNYFHGAAGPGGVCTGTMIVSHAYVTGLQVTGNLLNQDPALTTPTCWGIGFSNETGNTHAVGYINARFANNTMINTGNDSLVVSSCPSCVIEDNLMIVDWPSGGALGIDTAYHVTRGQDLVQNNAVIRNNTVWFGPNQTGESRGMAIGFEGTGYTVVNNTVSSAQTTGNIWCYKYDLALTSYAFINNNQCSATVSSTWELTSNSATLAAWKTFSMAYGFDTASITGAPNFISPSSTYGSFNFKPNAGSPLIGAGSHANAPTNDMTGTPFGNPPDIGAYTH